MTDPMIMPDDGTGAWSLEEARTGHLHSPALAIALSSHLPVSQPVVDLGCGLGYYASSLQEAGWEVQAFDGTPNIDSIGVFRGIQFADLSKPLSFSEQSNVVCLEVGEHIPVEAEQIFLDSLASIAKRRIILSWAIPDQGGKGHINERSNDYIISEMGKRGFVFKPEPTDSLRSVTKEEGELWWFENTIMVFDRVRIGLAMIVKNEANTIGRAIDSAIDFVDEYCIDMSGTTDDTEFVARTHFGSVTGHFINNEWLGAAAALNRCIEHLGSQGCDWVIRLDADTTIDGVLPILTALPIDCEGVSIPIHNADGWRVCDRAWVFRPTAHYKGVRHEGLWVQNPIYWTDLKITHHKDSGARPREATTYIDDADAMIQALTTENDIGMVTRYHFYIAKAYRDADEPIPAIAFYRLRAAMGGYHQEVGFALREIAVLSGLSDDWVNALTVAPRRADTAFYALQTALAGWDEDFLKQVVELTDHQSWDPHSMFADPSYVPNAIALLKDAHDRLGDTQPLKTVGFPVEPMNEGIIEHPLWLMWEEAIPADVCDKILEACRTLPKEEATTFGGHGESHRKTDVRWINPNNDTEGILPMLWGYIQQANASFNLDLTNLPYVQFTEYSEVGHHYSTHHDIDWNRQDGKHRKISVTVQLSDPSEYEGGEFSFSTHQMPDPVAMAKKGTIVCFHSYLDHMVSPIESGARSSLVAWAEGPRWT